MSPICLFPSGACEPDLFHHLQHENDFDSHFITSSHPSLAALHCLRLHLNDSGTCGPLQKTKGRQGLVFCSHKNHDKTHATACLHEKFTGAGNLSAPSLTAASREVCARIPLKCTTINEIWGSPVENHACNHLSCPLSLSAKDLEEALVPHPPWPSTSPLYYTLIFIEKILFLLSVAACSPQTWLIMNLKYGKQTLCRERLL